MVGYMLPLMTIAVLSHMTSIPSSSAAPQNYALPPISLLSTSSNELSLNPSGSSLEDDKSYFMEENDSSTSSWEDTSGSNGGKHDSHATSGGGGSSVLFNNIIKNRDDTSSSIMNSDEADDVFPNNRELHDSSVFHPIPNFLQESERPSLFRVKAETTRNKGSKQLPRKSQRSDDEDTFHDETSRGINGFEQHSLWNFPTIFAHSSYSNYPNHGVGKRNGSTKRVSETVSNIYGIQDNYGGASTFTRNEKRSPRCLRRCLAQGLLHPSQCHSLC